MVTWYLCFMLIFAENLVRYRKDQDLEEQRVLALMWSPLWHIWPPAAEGGGPSP